MGQLIVNSMYYKVYTNLWFRYCKKIRIEKSNYKLDQIKYVF